MNKKISILPIALMLIAICFLPTCVQAGPQHIVSVPSGPSEGNTMEDIDFTGGYWFGWGEPVDYEWDFDYDGNPFHFDTESTVEDPTTQFTLGKTYTVALKVTDCMDVWDIGTLEITIEATYNLQVKEQTIHYRPIFEGDDIMISGEVTNQGSGISPSYTVKNRLMKLYIRDPPWQLFHTFDDEDYDSLTRGAYCGFGPQSTGTVVGDAGIYRLYTTIQVDGVTVDEEPKGFLVWGRL